MILSRAISPAQMSTSNGSAKHINERDEAVTFIETATDHSSRKQQRLERGESLQMLLFADVTGVSPLSEELRPGHRKKLAFCFVN